MDAATKRERAVEQRRAEARERVRVAQEREAQQRADRREQARLRGTARTREAPAAVARETPESGGATEASDEPVIGERDRSEGVPPMTGGRERA